MLLAATHILPDRLSPVKPLIKGLFIGRRTVGPELSIDK
jgi:hypothetical protein